MFMSQYPYFELFFYVIGLISEHANIDANCLFTLKTLYEAQIEEGSEIRLPEYSYTLPLNTELRSKSAHYFCPTLFATLPLKALYEVLCCVLQEGSIIFQSQNLQTLTFSMYFLYNR